MVKRLIACIIALAGVTAAHAQLTGPSLIAVPPAQYGLTITSATHLTIPGGATAADVTAIGGTANYTIDGQTTPTGSVGDALAVGVHLYLNGPAMLRVFQAIQTTGGVTLNVKYFKTN